MRTLNLNEYGVAELNAKEMRNTDGGFLVTASIIAAIVVADVGLIAILCNMYSNEKARETQR